MSNKTVEQAELRRRLKEYRADHARAVRLLAMGNVNVDGAVKLERLADDRFIQFIADRDAKQKEKWEKDQIILACPEPYCNAAQISSRELSRWEGRGEITDPPQATTVWLPCPKHYEEGHEPYYTDKDGNEISADPGTWLAHLSSKGEKE